MPIKSELSHGLRVVELTSPSARAQVFMHGAHVSAFDPVGGRSVLFMSQASLFEDAKPIRGGLPVIFPWFGPRQGSAGPAHGIARLTSWTIDDSEPASASAVTLRLVSNDATRAIWPHEFELRYRVQVTDRLALSLTVRNTGPTPFRFEEALHTYFAVGDVRQASVEGLGGVRYIDKVDAAAIKTQSSDPIRITSETDRVYFNTAATCLIRDPAWSRSITVAKTHSQSTIVWNPWIAKAKAMPDFGDDEWPGMLCVESGNVATNAIDLAPGASHSMGVEIQAAPLKP